MNRENKRKQYEKGYYKTHSCKDSFTCKVCGRLVVSAGAGNYSSLPDMWTFKFQSRSSRRQPDETDVDCNEASFPTAFPTGKN